MTKTDSRSTIPFSRVSLSRRALGAARNVFRAYTNPSRRDALRSAGATSAFLAARRRARSRTARGHIREGKVMNEGTGGQYSRFTMAPGKCYLPKHVENALPPLVFQGNSATQVKSTVGKQAVTTLLTLNHPNIATTFSGDKTSNCLYYKSTGDVTLNNIYLSNCYVIIYDIIARKDVSAGALFQPDLAWSQGDTDEAAGGASTFLGSTPWQSEVFNQYYEVKQVTNVVLGAGATHVHKVVLKPQRLINASYASYTPYSIRGLTYFTMVEWHGSPANDSTTQTSVSVGVGGLNVITDFEHTLKQIQKPNATISAINSLATSFAVAEQVINIGGSTIVPQAEG